MLGDEAEPRGCDAVLLASLERPRSREGGRVSSRVALKKRPGVAPLENSGTTLALHLTAWSMSRDRSGPIGL